MKTYPCSFPASRILPFGCTDNFWEMGATGPCGPCTEIHIDHRPDLGSVEQRAKLVNAGRSDLTELWNLVFIQYNRLADGTISQLPAHHVDTGMGFERLTALLQNKTSNYDTDLFTPIFDGIQQVSKAPAYSSSFSDGAPLDTSYRILADHARMVTACLADGMLPDQKYAYACFSLFHSLLIPVQFQPKAASRAKKGSQHFESYLWP